MDISIHLNFMYNAMNVWFDKQIFSTTLRKAASEKRLFIYFQ